MAAMSSWCWLAVLVCLCGPSSVLWNLIFCSSSQFNLSRNLWLCRTCIYVGAASRLPLVVCFIQELILDGIIVHNSALLQFRYFTLGPKLYHEYLFESLTDQLLSDRHVGSK